MRSSHLLLVHTVCAFIYVVLSTNSHAQCPLDIDETSQPPSNNLILDLPFDGDAINLGSGSYNATVVGATYVNSTCGQALSFDGVNDYVKITPSMSLVNSYTVCAWINTIDQLNPMGIFSIREQCSSTYRGYSIAQLNFGDYGITTLNNQINSHQNCTGFSNGDRYTNSTIGIQNNTPTFICLTIQNNSSENRVVKLYVNCEEYSTIMTIDFPTNVCFNGSQNYVTTIGASSDVNGFINSFHGTIDQLRVYNTALNHEQILDVYQSCLPVSVDINNFSDCTGESAEIILYNSELNVDYQLVDITNNLNVGLPISGNCAPLTFNTGLVSSITQFQLQAVNVVSGCAISLDTIITLSPVATGFSGSQTINLCQGDSILINNQFIFTSGIYSDTISSFPCDSIIEVIVNVISIPEVDLGPDLSICDGSTVQLSTSQTNATFLWQDLSNQSTLNASQPGVYWLSVTNACGIDTDSVTISLLPSPDFYLGNDTTICEGTSIILSTTVPNSTTTWQDGSISNTFEVNQPGVYSATVEIGLCSSIQSIEILMTGIPTINLGSDTIICAGNQFLLGVPSSNYNFEWNNGSQEPVIIVDSAGVYEVTVTNQCGQSNDELVVETSDCGCEVYVPNSFTPDEKGTFNQTFKPVHLCDFLSYTFKIYNRWGELIFESSDQLESWDGRYKGKMVQTGVYNYTLEYDTEEISDKLILGHVNVLY